MIYNSWIGRLVKTLNESTTRRGIVVDEARDYVVVRFAGEFCAIEDYYNKNEVQFAD